MRTTCAECDQPEYARGLCSRHYQVARYHGQLPEAPPKTCEVCGATFTSRNRSRRFCSAACKEKARAERRSVPPSAETAPVDPVPCRHCGNPVTRHARAVFCSDACKMAAIRDKTRAVKLTEIGERRCQGCGTPIEDSVTLRAKFCSRSCRVAYVNRQRGNARRVKMLANRPPCRECGGEIPETRRSGAVFCSPECKKKATDARWRKRYPDYHRRRLYGLSQAEFESMLAAQGGGCAICGTSDWPGYGHRPHVDHDAETGRVRGLLCTSCNTGIGRLMHDPARLRAAAAYLEK